MKSQRISHTHLQFAQANTQPKIAKEYALPTLTEMLTKLIEMKGIKKHIPPTSCISNGGQSAKIETNMRKINNSAKMNKSAGNPATTHTHNRYAPIRYRQQTANQKSIK